MISQHRDFHRFPVFPGSPAAGRRLRLAAPPLAVVAATVLVAWLAYGLHYAPAIYSDDWTQVVGRYVHGSFRWVDWSDRRPLLDAPLLALTGVLGLDIPALHLTMAGLQVAAALQFYWLLRRLEAGSRVFALGVALLFLIFPADYTHMWLTMISAWVVMNLLFAYAHLLLAFARSGRPWQVAAACLALLVSLGIYEAQLGVALAWAVILAWIAGGAPFRRRIALLSPLAVGLLFAAWRVWGMPAIGVSDRYLGQFQANPPLLLQRIWLGLKVLAWSWIVLPLRATPLRSNWLAWGAVGAAVALGWLAGAAVARARIAVRRRLDPDVARQARRGAAMVGIGALLAAAGFLPILAVYHPNLTSLASRVNLFATIGASLAIASVASLAASALLGNGRGRDAAVAASLAPLLILGVATQAAVQADARVAWEEQRDIWQRLFTACPDLRADTGVYFILPGYGGRWGWTNWQRTPLEASWEVTSGLQVLYGDDSLSGDVVFPDLDRGFGSPAFSPEGIANYWSGRSKPWEEALFLVYDGTPRTLRLVRDLRSALGLTWDPEGYAPDARCTADPPGEIGWRRLVASPAGVSLQ